LFPQFNLQNSVNKPK